MVIHIHLMVMVAYLVVGYLHPHLLLWVVTWQQSLEVENLLKEMVVLCCRHPQQPILLLQQVFCHNMQRQPLC